MEKDNIHYYFTLSEEQLEYLRSKKYKMTHFSQILYYKPEGKLIFFEKSALLDWVRNVKVKSGDEIREETALHLSSLSVPCSERTHV
ncbi:MAG: hypothetical protein IJ729_02970 [Alloprevotella sp.]|nr:hypothetical protein [Alloprevotella sp.]